MKAELVPLNGDPPIVIINDVTVLGRRSYCDVVIDDESLSRRHAIVVRTDGLLMLRDLATTNGSKVNGQRVMWAALLPNDRVTLGRYKMRVYLGPDDQPSPSEERASSRRAAAQVADPDESSVELAIPLEFPTPTPLPHSRPLPDEPAPPAELPSVAQSNGDEVRFLDRHREGDGEPLIELD